MSPLVSLKESMLNWYFAARTSYPVWYHMLNRDAVAKHRTHPLPLSAEGKRVVDELLRSGVAVTSLDALFPGEGQLAKLQAWVDAHPPIDEAVGRKKFLRHYWDSVPVIDLDNPFLRLCLDERVLTIAQHYLGMWVRLREYFLAMTLPEPGHVPVQSQKWHRDPEEKKWCKMFIYLNDVDETAGPFTYALGSNWDGPYAHVGAQKPRGASYPPEGEVEAHIPKERIKSMTGKAGTVIFCDVAGLHFGGRATEKPRIMFTSCYNAPTFSEGGHFRLSDASRVAREKLSPAARYALSGHTIDK